MDVVITDYNMYLFEISFICPLNADISRFISWANSIGLKKDEYVLFNSDFSEFFLKNADATYMIFQDDIKVEIFFSLTGKNFFVQNMFHKNISDLINLLEDVYLVCPYKFCIANIDTNNYFISKMNNCEFEYSKFEKCDFIGLPNNVNSEEINKALYNSYKSRFLTLYHFFDAPLIYDPKKGVFTAVSKKGSS